MIWNRDGVTREVLLIGRYAFKLPKLTYGWRLFLQGLLANMQEATFGRVGWPELAPVVFSIPGGWLVVMRRAAPLTPDQWRDAPLEQTYYEKPGGMKPWGGSEEYVVPAEFKSDSFGMIDGRIVAVDYGS